MIILCYHELAGNEATYWILKPESFSEQLDVLLERGYRFDELPTCASRGEVNDKRVVVTFDDGTVGCIRYAHELLMRNGIKGYFYICPGFTDGVIKTNNTYMTWSDIQELAQYHVIGAHSMTHPKAFLGLSLEQRRYEMVKSKEVIEQKLGRACMHWATPHGCVDSDLKQMARDIGFVTLVTTRFGANRHIDPYCLERWEINSRCRREAFTEKLIELETQLRTPYNRALSLTGLMASASRWCRANAGIR